MTWLHFVFVQSVFAFVVGRRSPWGGSGANKSQRRDAPTGPPAVPERWATPLTEQFSADVRAMMGWAMVEFRAPTHPLFIPGTDYDALIAKLANSVVGFMVYGLWFMVYGLWFMVYGLWFMVYGLWFMVYGLWFMVYGLWWFIMVYGLGGCQIDCMDHVGCHQTCFDCKITWKVRTLG
jgi:hypothetical protein